MGNASGIVYVWIGIALMAAIVFAQFIRYPGQIVWKLLKTAVVGLVFVFAVNWVGSYFHYHLPLNPVTAMTAGILGVPGVVALVALQLLRFV